LEPVFRVLEFIALLLLPGAWLSCGLPICSLPLSAKLWTGGVLSPLVLIVEFYVVRALGVPFAITPHLLVAINLPALALVARRIGKPSLPGWRATAGWGVVLLVPLACLAPTLLDPQTRIYTGHAWMYSDPIYAFANGALVPEDPDVAGLRLAYPWGGLLYQGILSYVLNSPPAASYIWTNIAALIFVAGLCAGIVGELGGRLFTRITSPIWLLFGLNLVGYVLDDLDRRFTGRSSLFFGDYRYTPWYLKWYFFQQEPIALGMLLALIYVLLRRWPGGFTRAPLLFVFLLLADLAIVYPILMPAALAVVGARAAVALFDRWQARPAWPISQTVGLIAVLAVAAVVTLANTKFVTADVVEPSVRIGALWMMRTKVITTLVVLLPLLLGLAAVVLTRWRSMRDSIVFLGLAAAGSCFCFIVFQLPGFGAEYKFMLTAAACLAPFPALAIEPLMNRLGTRAVPAFAAVTLVLSAPLVDKLRHDWPWYPEEGLETAPPLMNLNGFDLRLVDGEPLAALVEAIRNDTSADTLVIAAHTDLHLPTLTARSMYFPPAQTHPHPGVNIKSADTLQETKGYSPTLLAQRQTDLNDLYTAPESEQRQHALDQMLALKRPLAIILDQQHDRSLLEWLRGRNDGRLIYDTAGQLVWLITPSRG
jgi:hypothetical protein